jgi:small subunit ribosomal protein S16
MSVGIRFKRVGRPHAPFYRLVAIDRRRARDAKPIEILGAFNPRHLSKPESIEVERIRYWVSTGAKPTETVLYALKTAGVWDKVKPGSPASMPRQ